MHIRIWCFFIECRFFFNTKNFLRSCCLRIEQCWCFSIIIWQCCTKIIWEKELIMTIDCRPHSTKTKVYYNSTSKADRWNLLTPYRGILEFHLYLKWIWIGTLFWDLERCLVNKEIFSVLDFSSRQSDTCRLLLGRFDFRKFHRRDSWTLRHFATLLHCCHFQCYQGASEKQDSDTEKVSY